MPDIYLLPDTNVFLHFPPISDVDWLALAGSQVVNLAIAPVISRELNDHKDAPRSRKLRDRAASGGWPNKKLRTERGTDVEQNTRKQGQTASNKRKLNH